MINISDVRVGSRIKWNETIHTVENIYSPDVNFTNGSIQTDIFDAQRDLEEFGGIELTSELLRQTGFNSVGNGWFDKEELSVHLISGDICFTTNTGQVFIKRNIKHLHQIQNFVLFFLKRNPPTV